jgi:hypothetical protein
MKKLFTFFIAIFFAMLTQLHAQSGDCSNPLTAVEGTNVSSFTDGPSQWYRFVMPVDGQFTISMVGLSTSHSSFEIHKGSCEGLFLGDIWEEGSVSLEKTFYAAKLDTLFVQVGSEARLLPWSLSISAKSVSAGNLCSNAVKADTGANTSTTTTGGEWYYFTPSDTGKIIFSSKSNRNDWTDNFVYVYSACNGTIENEGSFGSYYGDDYTYTLPVSAGKTYLFYIKNKVASNAGTTFDWNLSYKTFQTGNAITGAKIHVNFQDVTVSTQIDASAHTVTVNASSSADISNPELFFTVSSGASIYDANYSALQERTDDYDGLTYFISSVSNDTITYTVTADNGTEQIWTVYIKNPSKSSANDIISLTVDGSEGIINSISHTITVTVTDTVNDLFTKWVISPLAKVYHDATLLYNLSGYRYNDTITVAIVSEDSTAIQDWKIIPVLAKASDCSNATVAVLGANAGNGTNYSTQYFSFKPTTTGLYSLSTSVKQARVYVYKSCDDEGSIASGAVSTSESLTFIGRDTVNYIIEVDDLFGNDSLVISNLRKNTITDFWISYNDDWTETKNFDTVNHTASIVLDDPYADLSSLEYYFDVEAYSPIYAKVDNYNVGYQYSYEDFTNPVTFSFYNTYDSSLIASYTVTVTRRAAYTANDFLAYALDNQTGNAVIDPATRTIKIGIDTTGGIDTAALYPYFALPIGAWATDKLGTYQYSGNTSRDFRDTVAYNVYAEDSSVARWNVIPYLGDTVLKSNQANIAAYHFFVNDESIAINQDEKTISVVLPYGTSVSNLISWFTLSSGATASVSSIEQVSGVNANDLSNGTIVYVITAEDGTTTKEWTVTVSIIKNTATSITSYSLAGQTSSTVDADNHSVNVTVPYGTDLTSLVASFSLSDQATATVGSVAQVTGTSTNDFSSSVAYTVTAGDGITSQAWTVTVSVAKNTATDITAYSLAGQTSSTVDIDNHTVSVVVPYGTDVTALVATFKISDQATAVVNNVSQVSGTTANDFSNDLTYVVTAGDATTTQDWKISVSVTATSVSSIVSKNILSVYPNPNDGSFTLKLNNSISTSAKVVVAAVDGTIVYSNEFSVVGETIESINLNVATGSYIITVISGDTVNKQKIQVVR